MLDRMKVTEEEEAMLLKFRSLDARGKGTVLSCLNHQYAYMPLTWVKERRQRGQMPGIYPRRRDQE